MFVNVLMDWDQDGMLDRNVAVSDRAPRRSTSLVNFPVPRGFIGTALGAWSSRIPDRTERGLRLERGSRSASMPVQQNWNGAGTFSNGETCDYLLRVDPRLSNATTATLPKTRRPIPWLGVIGAFPTCVGSGPSGFVELRAGRADATSVRPWIVEMEGNAGNCPNFPPYDADECMNDGDAGLLFPAPFTIDPALEHRPVARPHRRRSLGIACNQARLGPRTSTSWSPTRTHFDALRQRAHGLGPERKLAGHVAVPDGPAPEHVLVNFIVPAGFSGPLSLLAPPRFLDRAERGLRLVAASRSATRACRRLGRIGELPDGETCDYLLRVDPQPQQSFEYGDAPEGAWAYPWLGVMGQFPTCVATGPAGFVSHVPSGLFYFGLGLDFEIEGNAGNCPNFPPYDADECQNDGDAGLILPIAFTIDAGLNPVACPFATGPPAIGQACSFATWGSNVDIHVVNLAAFDAFVNVLIDWDQSGTWGGAAPCPLGAAPEHVLVNFVVPSGFTGPLSGLTPPGFLIGPNDRFVWCRFTVSESPVPIGWDGSGSFQSGETCDYLLVVEPGVIGVDDRSEAITATRLLPAAPNPFHGMTTVQFEMASAGEVSVGVYDVAGRRLRTLAEGERAKGRYDVTWDGRTDGGRRVSAGMYFVRMRAGSKTFSMPLVLLR